MREKRDPTEMKAEMAAWAVGALVAFVGIAGAQGGAVPRSASPERASRPLVQKALLAGSAALAQPRPGSGDDKARDPDLPDDEEARAGRSAHPEGHSETKGVGKNKGHHHRGRDTEPPDSTGRAPEVGGPDEGRTDSLTQATVSDLVVALGLAAGFGLVGGVFLRFSRMG